MEKTARKRLNEHGLCGKKPEKNILSQTEYAAPTDECFSSSFDNNDKPIKLRTNFRDLLNGKYRQTFDYLCKFLFK